MEYFAVDNKNKIIYADVSLNLHRIYLEHQNYLDNIANMMWENPWKSNHKHMADIEVTDAGRGYLFYKVGYILREDWTITQRLADWLAYHTRIECPDSQE
jgi:hypothetical protein